MIDNIVLRFYMNARKQRPSKLVRMSRHRGFQVCEIGYREDQRHMYFHVLSHVVTTHFITRCDASA